LLAGLLLGLAFGLLVLGGWVKVVATNWQWSLVASWLLFFLVQPLAEEVVMRSFLQQQFAQAAGQQLALIATALVFAFTHAGNDNFGSLAGLQIFAGGYFIGQLFLRTGSLWAPYLFHAAWNFFQSTLLGFAVSGLNIYSVLQLDISGPAWLTGGRFGLEGSVLTLVFLLLMICYYRINPIRHHN
ncbi:MAG: CPBP family intramembrane glutamic endopeptidase, partial [Bacteroidota bacterium]